MIPVISVIGPSGVGKTTLLEGLLPLLKKRGLLVAVVKHHGGDFDIDQPGKDTWRLARAGATTVALSSPVKFAVIRRVEKELTLEEILPTLGGPDLVITEGYKGADYPKIQVFRTGFPLKLLVPVEQLVAAVADFPLQLPVPTFSFSDREGLANLLLQLSEGHANTHESK